MNGQRKAQLDGSHGQLVLLVLDGTGNLALTHSLRNIQPIFGSSLDLWRITCCASRDCVSEIPGVISYDPRAEPIPLRRTRKASVKVRSDHTQSDTACAGSNTLCVVCKKAPRNVLNGRYLSASKSPKDRDSHYCDVACEPFIRGGGKPIRALNCSMERFSACIGSATNLQFLNGRFWLL
jgi:hypothetical protein